jgi:uracil-DNA glycosylase
VRVGGPSGKGWERFTDEVTRVVDKKPDVVVFVLWGAEAQRKKKLIDASRTSDLLVPSFASIRFTGASSEVSRSAGRTRALIKSGKQAVDWSLTT